MRVKQNAGNFSGNFLSNGFEARHGFEARSVSLVSEEPFLVALTFRESLGARWKSSRSLKSLTSRLREKEKREPCLLLPRNARRLMRALLSP